MLKSSLFLVFFLCALFVVSFGAKYKWNCDEKDEAEIDDLASKMLTLGRDDMKLPLTTPEIKPFCRLESKLLAQGESYKDQCMKGHQKSVFSVAIYTLKQFINQVCKRPKSRKTQDLLKAVPCINGGHREYQKCNVAYIDMLDHIRTWKDFKAQVGHLCCGYYRMFNCIRDAAGRTKVCTRNAIEMLLDMIRQNTENIVNMLCGDFSHDSDRCDKYQLAVKPPKDLKKRSKSFVKPLISILANEG